MSYLFISHDLAVVRLISDYVCVMKDGKLVEAATSEEIFTNPRDPYTPASAGIDSRQRAGHRLLTTACAITGPDAIRSGDRALIPQLPRLVKDCACHVA